MSQHQAEAFVQALLKAQQEDNGLAARMRRADNPATEYQSWDFLARFGIPLDRPQQLLPYTTVGALMARSKATKNGTLSFGKALALSYPDGKNSDQAVARLRRVLSCSTVSDVCRILRPMLKLIDSRTKEPLDYVRLLRQLQKFGFDDQHTKAQWAQEFYA